MRELAREALGWMGYLERGQVLVQLLEQVQAPRRLQCLQLAMQSTS